MNLVLHVSFQWRGKLRYHWIMCMLCITISEFSIVFMHQVESLNWHVPSIILFNLHSRTYGNYLHLTDEEMES
jgi:hypothetical protein